MQPPFRVSAPSLLWSNRPRGTLCHVTHGVGAGSSWAPPIKEVVYVYTVRPPPLRLCNTNDPGGYSSLISLFFAIYRKLET